MMKKALIGFGGHAREVMAQMGLNLTCFVDDEYVCEKTKPLSSFNPNEFAVMVTVSDPTKRVNIINKLPSNTKFFTWVHPSVLLLSKDVEIGEGSFVGAYSILTTNIKIGKHSILNRGNQIGHDTIIGDFFSAMPGSIISGNVTIGNRVYIGTNSSVKEKLSIVDDVTIGLNTGIVKSITEKGVYVNQFTRKI